MTRPFKIAVAGTHSTGKTTFVAGLKARLDEFGLRAIAVHDSAADARARGFPILAAHTFESTAWLVAEAIRLETEASLAAEVVLVDRPVPDALGYLIAALRHQDRSLEAGRLERLEAVCRAWAGEYDLVFVTLLDEAVPIGPGRPDDLAFRAEAARAVAEVVHAMVPGAIDLPRGGAPEAIEICLTHLPLDATR